MKFSNVNSSFTSRKLNFSKIYDVVFFIFLHKHLPMIMNENIYEEINLLSGHNCEGKIVGSKK